MLIACGWKYLRRVKLYNGKIRNYRMCGWKDGTFRECQCKPGSEDRCPKGGRDE